MKAQILAAIGETELQPASALNAAFAANDRLKYVFSLLQMALAYAEHPGQEAATLKRERLACGIDDPDLDTAIGGARMLDGACRVPGAARLMRRSAEDILLMAAPVVGAEAADFNSRLASLLAALPEAKGDLLDPSVVAAMMQATHGGDDSMHRLVMDLHKRLNAMQAALATETLDGAATYNLAETDRPMVAAFMAGLNRTARLKFNHPGLATTATRADDKLLIQNDIGTTDAHVIVIHVQGLAVSVTYTDVHAERLAFFQNMLNPHKIIWEGNRTAVLAAGAPFYMATGRFEAANMAECHDYLEFLASRLVFLIDWNRARKQLRGFLRGPERLDLLGWAAQSETGHRGFLELGGAHLVNQAIEATAGASMHFGDRLCDILGDAETLDFLHFVFGSCTSGLLADQSHSLINDRIQAALSSHFQNQEQQLLRLAGDHAGLIFELACIVRDGLQPDSGEPGKRAHHAARFEHDADHLVIETRETVRRRPDYAVFLPLMVAADAAADELEDAAFLLNLDILHGQPLDDLRALAGLLVDASQEWIKALGHAHQIGAAAGNAEVEDFLAALDRISALEHEADDVERKLAGGAFRHAQDFRQLHLFNALGDRLEAAADALKHASLMLRDHLLEDVING
jgi:uncharacterized protein Yka (UPF0111/DUF47 family)